MIWGSVRVDGGAVVTHKPNLCSSGTHKFQGRATV